MTTGDKGHPLVSLAGTMRSLSRGVVRLPKYISGCMVTFLDVWLCFSLPVELSSLVFLATLGEGR